MSLPVRLCVLVRFRISSRLQRCGRGKSHEEGGCDTDRPHRVSIGDRNRRCGDYGKVNKIDGSILAGVYSVCRLSELRMISLRMIRSWTGRKRHIYTYMMRTELRVMRAGSSIYVARSAIVGSFNKGITIDGRQHCGIARHR